MIALPLDSGSVAGKVIVGSDFKASDHSAVIVPVIWLGAEGARHCTEEEAELFTP